MTSRQTVADDGVYVTCSSSPSDVLNFHPNNRYFPGSQYSGRWPTVLISYAVYAALWCRSTLVAIRSFSFSSHPPARVLLHPHFVTLDFPQLLPFDLLVLLSSPMVSPIRLRVPSISLSNSEDDLTDQREMLSERHLRLAADDLAAFFARIHPHLAGQPLRLREKDARAILEMLGLRPIQNEENIAVPSPQDCLEQLLEVIARINLESDANSPARTICTPRPEITDWERGDCIGKGSFGSVYKGYSKEHKLFFAAKGVPLDEDGHICHLENEIAILKPLDHKNIIQFYGTERGGKMLYIFIELVSQGTLEQAYKDFRFDESQVSNYTRQILQGLTHLHSRNVVHGDLKCANILVTESGRIKLVLLSSPMDDLTDQREMLSERHLRLAADDLAAFFARIHPHLAGQPLRLREKDARAILEMLGLRPIQNEENIAVPSPQDCLEQLLEICTPRPEITDWERGDCIGKGSFGSVYKGYSKEHKLFFAAKGVPLDEDGHICHLENEIAILKPLDHKNIIQFYGTERGGKMLYIFIAVRALEQAYKDFRFDESQVSNYTRQILQGLTHLHSRNVVHGDLKCANILVTESGRIKLADFGLSKSMEDHSQSLELGLRSSFWMAPEVANPKRGGYGFPSDIWSLGCTVTELSTRKYPQYNGRDNVSLALAIRRGKGPVVPDYLSDTLKDFINQCLQPIQSSVRLPSF
uniref:mitogen-activated protein kinase kinase kinase n=1 Tax=Salix viminalis TaxID=40686 RepID=A0A6N2L190_SALVM